MSDSSSSNRKTYQTRSHLQESESFRSSSGNIGQLLIDKSLMFVFVKVDPDQSLEEVKKKFRRMSILVHPDKNQGDAERAQIAFDAVKRAWNLLGNISILSSLFKNHTSIEFCILNLLLL